MTFDDLKKLATSGTIFNLDRMIAPKIIKALYLFGLGCVAIWAVRHLFGSFALSFSAGIWGLFEIGVIGITSFVLLRILCEALLVFFKKNAQHITLAPTDRPASNIIDDVKEAIEELAEDDDVQPQPVKAAPAQKTKAPTKRAPAKRRTTTTKRRTATKAKSDATN